MKYVLEHESLGESLKAIPRAGAAGAAGEADADAAVIFVAWSSIEALLLRPEYACLSLPGITYLRLPRPLDELRFAASSDPSPLSEAVPCAGLATPGGQWEWALDELLKDSGQPDRGRFMARLVEMRRFAAGHWPGWYEGALNAMGEAAAQGRDTSGLIGDCRRRSPLVESLEAAAPFARWARAGANRHSIELVREVAAYTLQGAVEPQVCRQVISDEPGWRTLRDCCDGVALSLSKLHESGRPVNAKVMESADEICTGVAAILESPARPGAAPDEGLRELAECAERVWSALQSLAALRESTRASLRAGT